MGAGSLGLESVGWCGVVWNLVTGQARHAGERLVFYHVL